MLARPEEGSIASNFKTFNQSPGLAKHLSKLARLAGKLHHHPCPVHRSVVVRSPATSANLGPGFDIFAMALTRPYDDFRIEIASDGLTFEVTGPYAGAIPTDPQSNVAGFVARHMLDMFGIEAGLRVHIRKNIRPRSGLGSSAAGAMAMAGAIDRMFNLGLTTTELIEWAALGELLSGGVPHVDNVSAAFLGGFIVITCREPLEVVRYDPHPSLRVVLAVPDVDKESTQASRDAVGTRIAITKAEAMLALQEACGIITGRVEDIISATRSPTHIEAKREAAGFYRYLTELKEIGRRF
ncbi:MAG: homoserine kinase, partial [Dehalococcoidia bacterium]|nr:homoserine kinase [Dehalococcoidia bacterium]